MQLAPSASIKDKQYTVKTFSSTHQLYFVVHLRLLPRVNLHLAGCNLWTLLSASVLRMRITAF